MKKLLIALFATILLFTLFYLLGSFTNKSFNLNNWTDTSLCLVGSFGGVISIMLGIITFIELDKIDYYDK